jgi:uncharacterized protein (DUF302 family)
MYHIVDTDKPFDQAATALEAAVTRHGFGVLHVHDLAATLNGKGVPFDEACKIFEVCSPVQAARLLAGDMRLNTALPCRISVFTEHGRTRIGLIKPVDLIAVLSDDPALVPTAREIEASLLRMVDEAR